MLVDLLNVVGVPVPPADAPSAACTPDASSAADALGRAAAADAAGTAAGSVDVSDAAGEAPTATAAQETPSQPEEQPSEPSLFARWAAANAPAGEGAEAADGIGATERWVLHLVNAEFERSKATQWRRLFPSKRSHEYLPFLQTLYDNRPTARPWHALPFDV
jgi:hypothetical protein